MKYFSKSKSNWLQNRVEIINYWSVLESIFQNQKEPVYLFY